LKKRRSKMRKVFLAVIVLAFILIGTSAFAQLRLNSGAIATDTLLYTGKAGLCGLIVVGDGTNAAVVTVYDNTSATGVKFPAVTVPAGEYLGGYAFPTCLEAKIGLYVDVSANTIVYVQWVRQ
jgi:hypothetical protein